ncbi:DUF2971 domain-containing protein [Acinetobacter sp. KS-LM10]|uniref:DUF2971 domain-containing protein n=1 Tax=Acinetobacter sp. KS-LM10 TaxID=3120518 RepID=UPI0030D19D87
MEKHLHLGELDQHAKIWRYMDLTKFLDLILNQEIYLRRIDKFQDVYEGFVSAKFCDVAHKSYADLAKPFGKSEEDMEELSNLHINNQSLLPMYSYASCWYIGEEESAAMWKLYGETKNCIAILTSVANLEEALINDNNNAVVYIKEVTYHEDDKRPESINWLNPLFEKRTSFKYEQELRVLYFLGEGLTSISYPNNLNPPDKKSINNPDGIKLKINLATLVNGVYISPEADPHFKGLVEKLLDRMGLQDIGCIQSELYTLK